MSCLSSTIITRLPSNALDRTFAVVHGAAPRSRFIDKRHGGDDNDGGGGGGRDGGGDQNRAKTRAPIQGALTQYAWPPLILRTTTPAPPPIVFLLLLFLFLLLLFRRRRRLERTLRAQDYRRRFYIAWPRVTFVEPRARTDIASGVAHRRDGKNACTFSSTNAD